MPADTAQRGVIDASYSVSDILLFDDVAGQNAYQVHPTAAHLFDPGSSMRGTEGRLIPCDGGSAEV